MGAHTVLCFGTRARGTGPNTSAQLIRNGSVLYSPVGWGEADRIDREFVDWPPAGTSCYCLRVQQLLHGDYVNAWSSPIWVRKGTVAPPAPAE